MAGLLIKILLVSQIGERIAGSITMLQEDAMLLMDVGLRMTLLVHGAATLLISVGTI